MHASSSHGPTLLRRLLLIAASLTIGISIWHLLGDSEGLVAEEKPPRTTSAQPAEERSAVLAHVDGMAITDRQVKSRVAEELAELETQRRRLLAAALESQINEQLIESEAMSMGLDPAQLMEVEVEQKLDQVADGAVQALYDAQVFSEPLAAIEMELRRRLRTEAYLAELRERAAVDVY